MFKARPGLVQTTREQLLSGNNMVHLAQIVALRQHVNFAQELGVVFQADVKWYEVPRDSRNKLDCSQVGLRELQLLGHAFTFMSGWCTPPYCQCQLLIQPARYQV